MTEALNQVLQRKLRLERGLVRVRWFGILFGIFQILQGKLPLCPSATAPTIGCEGPYVRPLGYTLLAVLAVFNVVAAIVVRRSTTPRVMTSLGAVMFAIDHLGLIGLSWLFSGTPDTTTWVMLYILPLEGALRYGMRGALISLAVLSVSETGRDIFRREFWGFPFNFVPDTTFRIGIMAIIGMVAGMMARNLERERLEVEKKAAVLERLAQSESAARREVHAFHQATLAGVSTGNFAEAMQKMMSTIGESMGFDSLAMGLITETPDGPRLQIVAGHKYPRDKIGASISLEEGICGPVVTTGQPAIVNDVLSHEGYLDFAPWARSEMAVPLQIGEKIIGVLNVESPRENAFDEVQLQKLARLAPQVAVVVENAKLLAREQAAVERLTELDTMKTDFIAITSHELRTPLTVIRGFIQTLLRSDVQIERATAKGYLEIVDRQTMRLQTIVEDLLFVSRIEAGEVELKTSSVDIKQMIDVLIENDFTDQATRLIVHSPPKMNVVTDGHGMRKVLHNLIDNALKFSPAGSAVSVSVLDRGGSVEISVQDDGVGIDPDQLDRIFDRFHQVGGSMKRTQQGFGLGLYVVKKVVDALGGSVKVASVPGRGSTFTLTLPKARMPAPITASSLE